MGRDKVVSKSLKEKETGANFEVVNLQMSRT